MPLSGDGGCPVKEFCNTAQKCQSPTTCNFSADCPADFFCDTAAGQCIASASCAQNIHCPLGSVCKAESCTIGCQTDGDCPLADFSGSPPRFVPYACFNGQCVQNGCHSSADCPAFYVCGANAQCQPACTGSSSFCAACDPTLSFFGNVCGSAANLCLTDSRNPTDCSDGGCRFFCGTDCLLGAPCPQGAVCTNVTAVSPGVGGPGQVCNAGTTCPYPSGAIRCPAQEGAAQGVCPCVQDTDCPTDFTGANLVCDVASGSCLVGKQCAPDKQYTCQTNNCGGG